MAKLLKLRGGTTTEHSSFTGEERELTIDTTKDTAVVHDGTTAGGHPLQKELGTGDITSDLIADNNVTADELNVSGNGTSGQYLTSDGDGSMSWTTLTVDSEALTKDFTVETGKTVAAGDVVNFYQGKIGFNPVANTLESTSTPVTADPSNDDGNFQELRYIFCTPDNNYLLMNRQSGSNDSNFFTYGNCSTTGWGKDSFYQHLDPSNNLAESTPVKIVDNVNENNNHNGYWARNRIYWIGTNSDRRFVYGGGGFILTTGPSPSTCGVSVSCSTNNSYYSFGYRTYTYIGEMNATYSGYSKGTVHSRSSTGSTAYAYYDNSYNNVSTGWYDQKYSIYHDDMAIHEYRKLCSSVSYENYYTTSLTSTSYSRSSSNSTVFSDYSDFRPNNIMGRPHNSKAKGFKDFGSTGFVVFDWSSSSGMSNETTYTSADMVSDNVNGSRWCRPDRDQDILIAFSKTANNECFWYTLEIDYTNERLNMLNKFQSKIYNNFSQGDNYRLNYQPDNKFHTDLYMAVNTDTHDSIAITYMEFSKPQLLTAEIDPTTLYVTGEGAIIQLFTTNSQASVKFRENGTDSQTFDVYQVYDGDLYHKVFTLDNPSTAGIQLVGVANESGTGGDTVSVTVAGIAGGFTGLTTGVDYFYDMSTQDGSITTTSAGNIFLGHSISDTEIQLTDLSTSDATNL